MYVRGLTPDIVLFVKKKRKNVLLADVYLLSKWSKSERSTDVASKARCAPVGHVDT